MNFKIPESKLPRTWQDLINLKDFISKVDSIDTRFPDDDLFYYQYRRLVSKTTRIKILLNTLKKSNIKILRNAFPYYRLIKYLPNVYHYCLWSQIGPLDSDTIESKIKQKFPGKDYFWFENSDKTKSMPEIWHCQVFVKED